MSISVSHYLAGMSESISKQHEMRGRYPFITISRQSGAGGQTLAKIILHHLKVADNDSANGWAIFDADMCASLVDDPTLESQLEQLLDERYQNPFREFVHELIGEPAHDLGYAKLAKIIHDIASLGRVIFVGRGASCITEELPLGVNVRLIAPLEIRKQRKALHMDASPEEALKEIQSRDHERTKLLKKHFRVDIDDPENYDAVWNTARVSLDHVAQAVLALSQERLEEQEAATTA